MSDNQRFIIVPILFGFLFASASLAQSTFGSFVGTVKDPSGAVVPGASVEVSNEGTGATHKATTSSAGVFNVPNLDIGNYRIRVSAKGFNSYERAKLFLEANQVINLDIALTLGGTVDVVEVTGASP